MGKSPITKKGLLEEIDFLRQYYEDIGEVTMNAFTRDAMIDILVQYRKLFFEHFPEIRSATENQLKAEAIADRTSTRDQRVEELQLLYYQLTDEAKIKYS